MGTNFAIEQADWMACHAPEGGERRAGNENAYYRCAFMLAMEGSRGAWADHMAGGPRYTTERLLCVGSIAAP
ncbi:hypothetical protein [Paenibacillus koleovorans]|uniref:hypothetical protein n=1 Tax=Paenibacillus koleovorans TaxID=121608 RepID=UPI0013E34CBB|nr:hypothetical protein [Paenibacillus koleovorans]